MECPDNEGSIPFSGTNSTPNPNHTIHTTLYRKPTHTDRYLDWNSNHPISAKRSAIQALTYWANMVCSTPELLAKEMDYLNKVLHSNSYPDWFLNKPNKRPHMHQATNQETTKEFFVTVSYIQGLSEEFRRIFQDTKVQIFFKGCKILKTLLMHATDKIPTQLHQDMVYQLACTNENCISSYTGESSRCLECRVKEHNTSSTSPIFQHCTTHNHPKGNISEF